MSRLTPQEKRMLALSMEKFQHHKKRRIIVEKIVEIFCWIFIGGLIVIVWSLLGW